MTREKRAARKAAGKCLGSDGCRRKVRPGTQQCSVHARQMARRQRRYNRKQYRLRIVEAICRRCGREDTVCESLCKRCWMQTEMADARRRPPERRTYRCGRCGEKGHTAKGLRCPARFRPNVTIEELALARNAA